MSALARARRPADWRKPVAGLLVFGSLASAALLAWQIAAHPLTRSLGRPGAAEIRLRLDRALVARVDSAWLGREVSMALDARPADWPRIDALMSLSGPRGLAGVALDPGIAARLAARDSAERGALAMIGDCALGVAARDLSGSGAAIACGLANELLPTGDLKSLAWAGSDYLAGREVDRLTLGLSALGLAAAAGAPLTGGTSYGIKAGVATLKIARRLGALTRPLTATMRGAMRGAVRLDRLPSPGRLMRMGPGAARRALDGAVDWARLAPMRRLAADMGGVARAVGPVAGLRMLRYVDGPGDAARLLRVSDAAPRRAVAALEALGKARVFRLAARLSGAAARALALAAALAVQAFGLVWLLAKALALRRLSRLV